MDVVPGRPRKRARLGPRAQAGAGAGMGRAGRAAVGANLRSPLRRRGARRGDAAPLVLGAGASLHVAAEEGQLRTCTRLVLLGHGINAQNRFEGQTPLHKAVLAEQAHTVALLLDLGADPCIRDKSGRTPLQYALQRRHEVVIRLLADARTALSDAVLQSALAVGLSAPTVSCLLDIRAKHTLGDRTLALAFAQGHAVAVEQLRTRGEVPRLGSLCRRVIRKHLSPSLPERLHALPLPPALLSQLNFGLPYYVPATHKLSPLRLLEGEAREGEWLLVGAPPAATTGLPQCWPPLFLPSAQEQLRAFPTPPASPLPASAAAALPAFKAPP